MAKQKILHFGLNRSGTNYLKELVDSYFDVTFVNTEGDRANPLHKHFRLYDNKELIGRPNFKNDTVFSSFEDFEHKTSTKEVSTILIVSKDPYSWNLSYDAWGKKNKWEASPHPYILEYNEFYGKWLEFSRENPKIYFIRYVDLIEKPEEVLKLLKTKYKLKLKRSIRRVRRIKKVPMSHRFPASRITYYIREEYLEEYSPGELSMLNSQVDHDLVEALGYEIKEGIVKE